MDNVSQPGSTNRVQDTQFRTANLMPIGRFSKMTRLSVKALRLYDELGLLRPAWVDPSSSYRYYAPGQANRAEAIRVLRRVEMPLEDIAEVLAANDPEVVVKWLGMHRDRLAERLAQQERTLRFLERLIDQGVPLMSYEITVKEIAPQTVAAVRAHTSLQTIADQLEAGFGAAVRQIGVAGGMITGAPFVVFHAMIDEETDGDIEICIPATGVAPDDEVHEIERPAELVASTVHHGPYDEVAPAYHVLAEWIQEHGHQIAGPGREVYLNDPGQVLADELLTEVQWPIEREA